MMMSLVSVQYEPFESDDEGAWVDLTPQKQQLAPILSKVPEDENCWAHESTTTSRSLVVGSIPDDSFPDKTDVNAVGECPIITWERTAPKIDAVDDTNDKRENTTTNDKRNEQDSLSEYVVPSEKQPRTLEESVEELSKLKQVNTAILSKLKQSQDALQQTKQENERLVEEMRTELTANKQQRDDIEKKLRAKETALERARGEVETLKKVIHQNTSMVSMQRDHAVSAMSEKDRILQNYKDKINKLTDDLNETKRREQQIAKSFEREVQMLQESLASVQTPQSGDEEEEDDKFQTPHKFTVFTPIDINTTIKNSESQVSDGNVKVKSLLSSDTALNLD